MNMHEFYTLLDSVVTLANARKYMEASDKYLFAEELMPEEASEAVANPHNGTIHFMYVECLERRLEGLVEIEEAKTAPAEFTKPFTVERDKYDEIAIRDADDHLVMIFNDKTQVPLSHREQLEAEALRWLAEATRIADALNKSYEEDS